MTPNAACEEILNIRLARRGRYVTRNGLTELVARTVPDFVQRPHTAAPHAASSCSPRHSTSSESQFNLSMQSSHHLLLGPLHDPQQPALPSVAQAIAKSFCIHIACTALLSTYCPDSSIDDSRRRHRAPKTDDYQQIAGDLVECILDCEPSSLPVDEQDWATGRESVK